MAENEETSAPKPFKIDLRQLVSYPIEVVRNAETHEYTATYKGAVVGPSVTTPQDGMLVPINATDASRNMAVIKVLEMLVVIENDIYADEHNAFVEKFKNPANWPDKT